MWALEISHLTSTNERSGIYQFKFHLIESKKSSHIQHHASKTRRQLSSFFHKQDIQMILSRYAQKRW
jgi:hypothetical protein